MIYTAESVTKYHPDKICDQIADAILDECLKQDEMSRVAVECIGGHNKIFIVGEVTTKAHINYREVAEKLYKELTGKDIYIDVNIVTQSPEISKGVNKGGAGDQGIMIGYACNENSMKIPQELYLARLLLEPFETDGKSQITIDDNKVKEVVLSVQGKKKAELDRWIKKFFQDKGMDFNYYSNNTGSFDTGGFDADSGCTGRKIVVDQYGPRVPVGGGSFSGKDPTKVDRSGAYMARFIALDMLQTMGGEEALVKIAYVIGKPEPVMLNIKINGKDCFRKYDCRPEAIIERFNLRKPIYLKTAQNGHFGIKNYPWEEV